MRTILPFGVVFLCLAAAAAFATEAEFELFQPVEGRSDLVLRSARGKASVERAGGSTQRVGLRSDELLTAIAETDDGWVTAGVRAEPETSSLIVIRRSSQGTRRVSPPAGQRHPIQARPALATHRDELTGLAWLEGSDPTSLSVRAASAEPGGGWSPVAIVAPPARGSQAGLVSAVLDNGDWLLVWSAFDGKDDEILWSIGRGDVWSVARRLHRNNNTPDILPALVTTRDGALLIWSRQVDGEYRLQSARFDGDSWSPARTVGPPGSLAPSFAYQDGRLLLLYRHAWPRGWAVAEVDNRGEVERLAVSADGGGSRPVLRGARGDEVILLFADQRRELVGLEALP